jgi:hypothetical protein
LRPQHNPFVVLLGSVGLSGCGEGASTGTSEAAARRAADEAALARAREASAAKREAQRLAVLWNYYDVPAGKGREVSATIFSATSVETDGQSAKPVRLVFRDHPSWGRSSYLVLEAGDFNCYGKCTVAVIVDDAAPRRMAARRPPTDEAIAMFINDWRAVWGLTAGAARLSVEFPVKAGGTRTATFEVGGLDRSKMPGWDAVAEARGIIR